MNSAPRVTSTGLRRASNADIDYRSIEATTPFPSQLDPSPRPIARNRVPVSLSILWVDREESTPDPEIILGQIATAPSASELCHGL